MIRNAYFTVFAAMVTAMVAATGNANGQEDLNRRVDVSKDYAPRVEKAVKLAVQPQVGDTTTLRPNLDYTIRPRVWGGGFEVAPIRAAQMNRGTYNPQYPLYIKAGGGFPGQTLLDVYATSIRPGASGFGFYANHRAQLADIANYFGTKQQAKSTTNSVGVFGKAAFGRLGRLSIAGDLGFDYDVWSDYGDFYYTDNQSMRVTDIRMHHYATPHANLSFGNDFTDLSFWNFRVGGDIYHLQDRTDCKETGGKAFVGIGKQFDLHQLSLGVDMEKYNLTVNRYLYFNEVIDYYSNAIISAFADYRLVHEKVSFGMGARFALERPTGYSAPDNKTWFLPQVELKIAASNEFNPYARLTSGMEINSYRATSSFHPFLYRKFMGPVPATASYDLRAGFNGTLGGVFSYDVYVGGGIVRNDIVPQNILGRGIVLSDVKYSLGIIAQTDEKRRSIFAGAEIEARIGGGFTVTAAGRYDKFSSDLFDQINYLPDFTASLGVKYNHLDKWCLRAGIEVRGEYKFLAYNDTGLNPLLVVPVLNDTFYAPAAVNLTLGADYFLSQRLGIFLEGNNLANQKLYPLPFYRGSGISVSAGVKLRF